MYSRPDRGDIRWLPACTSADEGVDPAALAVLQVERHHWIRGAGCPAGGRRSRHSWASRYDAVLVNRPQGCRCCRACRSKPSAADQQDRQRSASRRHGGQTAAHARRGGSRRAAASRAGQGRLRVRASVVIRPGVQARHRRCSACSIWERAGFERIETKPAISPILDRPG